MRGHLAGTPESRDPLGRRQLGGHLIGTTEAPRPIVPRESCRPGRRRICAAISGLLCAGLIAWPVSPAGAFRFDRVLHRGMSGTDVRALEMRVAGWFPRSGKVRLRVDRHFGRRTVRAVKSYQRRHGLVVDGVAGPQTFKSLRGLQDRDGTTAHFGWGEFDQNRSGCRRARRYDGTFKGGRVRRARARQNMRRFMWRLEAIRSKTGGRPVEVVSGFRSVAHNRCVGGASRSQHLYGTAADIQIHGVRGHRERVIARRSQVHGIECYAWSRHTHLDLRLENNALESSKFWWWPKRDRRGRDLSSDGRVCSGER
jgi:zinc D-Ala-D-Ala carboxypeptidase